MELLGRTVIDLTHPMHPRMPVPIRFPRLTLGAATFETHRRLLDAGSPHPALALVG